MCACCEYVLLIQMLCELDYSEEEARSQPHSLVLA